MKISRHRRGGQARARRESRRPHRRRLGRPGVDQRRELPRDEARRPAVRPVERSTCRATPNVDVTGKPTTRIDFSEPVEGLEAPWGMAQLTFYADGARVPQPPRSMAELLEWAQEEPGPLHLPEAAGSFHGTTFLKQVLLEASVRAAGRSTRRTRPTRSHGHRAAVERARRAAPAPVEAGQAVPGQQHRHAPDAGRRRTGDLAHLQPQRSRQRDRRQDACPPPWWPTSMAPARSATRTSSRSRSMRAPRKARRWWPTSCSRRRRRRARPTSSVWGDPTVLALDKLSAADRALFAAGAAPGQLTRRPRRRSPEPHGSWVDPIEREWARRYGSA